MPETTQFGGSFEDSDSIGSLKPNHMLLNRYRILAEIGGGGMGTVYKAVDTNFQGIKRLVAVKEMLAPNNSEKAARIEQFQREANLLATMEHPSITRIYEHFHTQDRAYIIMEYINGSDLDVILNKTRELPVDKVVEWAIELCDVLHYLHSMEPQPVIFRDLKPANIMIDSLGKVRLIDFGIAKVFEADSRKHTMIGTEGYSAPEQYRGAVSPLSDIYGLGATLHHILTRSDPRLAPPFSFNERPIAQLNPKVPPTLIDVIDRALQTDPKDRWQSGAAMKDAILHVYRQGGSASFAHVPPNPSEQNAPQNPASAQQSSRPAPAMTSTMTDFFGDMTEDGAVIEPRWVFSTEDEIRGSPNTYRDMAFVGSYDTNMWAIKLDTGELAWKYPTMGGIVSSPVIDSASKLVLFGSEDSTYYALDHRSGRIQWTHTTGGKIRSSGQIAHDLVFFGSDDNHLYALVAATGKVMWSSDLGSPVRTRPFVTNELVITASDDGEIVGLELSGKRKWSYRVKRGANSSPHVDLEEDICFIGGMDGVLYALDASGGYNIWRHRTNGPLISSPVSNGSTVFIGSTDGKLYAINMETGKERWSFDAGAPIVASPTITESAVYIGCSDGTFYGVDLRNGKELWRYATHSGITSTACIAGDVILFGAMNNKLYALPLVG